MLQTIGACNAVQRDKPIRLPVKICGHAGLFVSPFNLDWNASRRRTIGESGYASSKTRYKAARTPQKAVEAREGLFPHKGQTLPFGERGRESFAALHVSRPPHAQARLPLAVDSAYRRGRAQQRLDVQPVDSRAEAGRRGSRPQIFAGNGSEGCRRF